MQIMNPTIHNSPTLFYSATFRNSETLSGGTASYKQMFYSQASSVWTRDITTINSTTETPIFIDNTFLTTKGLPSNHPAWEKLESMLTEIDQNPNYVDDLDDNWLNDLRSGWSDRSSDFYDFTNWD
jgi:hypothetical protein